MADDSSDAADKDRNTPTVRDLKVPGPTDTVPDIIGTYVPPRPLPEASQHRTMDLSPVRISAHADPRRAPTERRLVAPAPTKPRRSTAPLVLGAVVVVLLGLWALLRTPSISRETQQLPPAPPNAPAAAPVPFAAPPAPAEVSPEVPSALPLVQPPAAEAPFGAKPPRPRETAKKRRDPWLE